MSAAAQIIFVPGLLPKPREEIHCEALLRCLLAGVERIDPDIAAQLVAAQGSFELVSWTYDFYGEHRDFALDAPSVDALIEQGEVRQRDQDEATGWRKRLARSVLMLADHLPFLIPHVVNDRMRLHLRDLRRYLGNRNEVAEHTRDILKTSMRKARDAGRPILLIAHSMGSVIAYEALWQMSRANREAMQVDLLLTMGSPLGQRYMQQRIKGSDSIGSVRYPNNVRQWINLSAAGDMTALDSSLRNDFDAMLCEGLVESIDDRRIYNWFRLDGVLNPHAEYGYLINPETAAIVVEWWRSVSSGRGSA